MVDSRPPVEWVAITGRNVLLTQGSRMLLPVAEGKYNNTTLASKKVRPVVIAFKYIDVSFFLPNVARLTGLLYILDY